MLTFRQKNLNFFEAKKIVKQLEEKLFGNKFPFFGISFIRFDKYNLFPFYQVFLLKSFFLIYFLRLL